MKRIFAGLIILLSLTASGAVYNLENIPNPKVVDSRTYVSNPDGIIRDETVRELNILFDSLEKATRTEVAVVLVESISDEDIEMFATSLFKNGGVGKAKEDNGLLILFVLDQKAIRFET
ncbi:MAG: TPM domain-containing protein, partial [Paludibacter sp.]|nr:TPM domain-containing protein [Paludibacter sp.]